MCSYLKRIIFVFAALCLIPFFHAKSNLSDRIEQRSLTSFISSWQKLHQIPAVSVLIKKQNNIYYYLNGYTKLNEQGTKIDENTLFGVGSITKTFISAMILKLEAEHELNINDKLGKYLPEYIRWKNIPLKSLLNMTSGIYNFSIDKTFERKLFTNSKLNYTAEDLINIAYKHKDNFPSGTDWDYPNTNYLLLGKVIEKVTKKTLPQALQEGLFKPYGLKHTFFTQTFYESSAKNLAHSYYNSLDTTTILPYFRAAGAMIMSAKDIESWVDALFIKKNVLPDFQLNEILESIMRP